MDWIKELNENKDIIINDFKDYLFEEYTEFYNNLDDFILGKNFNNELSVKQYIKEYIVSLHYDIQQETECYAEQLRIENEISKILYEYLGVDTNGD